MSSEKKKYTRQDNPVLFLILLVFLVMVSGCGTNTSETTYPDASEVPEEDTGAADIAEGSDVSGTVVTCYNIECYIDGILYANGSYPQIRLSDDTKNKYPKLSGVIDELNEQWKSGGESNVAMFAPWAKDMIENSDPAGQVFYSNSTAVILRADDAIYTVMQRWDDYTGGAHPNHGTIISNYLPSSGKEVSLQSVLDDDTDLTKHIYDELLQAYPDYGIEELGEIVPDSIDGMYYGGGITTWYLDVEGLHIHYDPYDIAGYAIGDLDVVLTYDKYPNLVKERYRVNKKQELEGLVEYRDDDNVIKVNPVYDTESSEAVVIENPTWEKYTAEGVEAGGSLIQIDEISEDRYDWLDSGKWVMDNGYTKTGLPYTDGDYYYETYDPLEYEYMYQKLAVYLGTDPSGPLEYNLDLSVLCNGPDEDAQKTSGEGQYIRFAAIYDGVLYVSTSHLGYSTEEPDSAYVAAIDLSTFSLLWKSRPLVCNSENFVIAGDALICGYGFTDEPDYIYALDLGDGSIVNQIPVRTAPYVFALEGSTLHVATYNSDYTFEISFG